ncbi:hypothetical protein HK405_010311, partial [Cladochytrium tenue]
PQKPPTSPRSRPIAAAAAAAASAAAATVRTASAPATSHQKAAAFSSFYNYDLQRKQPLHSGHYHLNVNRGAACDFPSLLEKADPWLLAALLPPASADATAKAKPPATAAARARKPSASSRAAAASALLMFLAAALLLLLLPSLLMLVCGDDDGTVSAATRALSPSRLLALLTEDEAARSMRMRLAGGTEAGRSRLLWE